MAFSLSAQDTKDIDGRALAICDRMSDVIGDLSSCSFTVKSVTDVSRNHVNTPIAGNGLITRHRTSDVYFSGHNNLMVDTHGDRGHVTIWYDGYDVSMYSYHENNYITVQAPDSTVNMMYAIYDKYGIEFPAADFFNPHFTDDLITNMNSVQLVGRTEVDGRKAFHIVARNDEMNVEFWFSDDGLMLPVKMRIAYLQAEGSPRHDVTFSKWALNPNLPGAMFSFSAPVNARKVSIGTNTSN